MHARRIQADGCSSGPRFLVVHLTFEYPDSLVHDSLHPTTVKGGVAVVMTRGSLEGWQAPLGLLGTTGISSISPMDLFTTGHQSTRIGCSSSTALIFVCNKWRGLPAWTSQACLQVWRNPDGNGTRRLPIRILLDEWRASDVKETFLSTH